MKLSQGDKSWLSAEIEKSATELRAEIKASRPNGWRKTLYWLREWGLLTTNITVIVTLLGLLITAVYNVASRREEDGKFRQHTSDRLDNIDKKLSELNQRAVDSQLSNFTLGPPTSEAAKKVINVVETVRGSGAQVDRQVVVDTGKHFLRASNSDAEAWQAVNVLLSYQTSIILDLAPKISGSMERGQSIYKTPPGWTSLTQWIGRSEAPEVPQLHRFDEPDLNAGKPSGPAFLIIHNGTVNLDDMVMKRIVFQDATITYSGAPTVLEKVYFVNCKFQMRQSGNSLRLADATLNVRGMVNFSTVG